MLWLHTSIFSELVHRRKNIHETKISSRNQRPMVISYQLSFERYVRNSLTDSLKDSCDQEGDDTNERSKYTNSDVHHSAVVGLRPGLLPNLSRTEYLLYDQSKLKPWGRKEKPDITGCIRLSLKPRNGRSP